jgi:hypothetical protein
MKLGVLVLMRENGRKVVEYINYGIVVIIVK